MPSLTDLTAHQARWVETTFDGPIPAEALLLALARPDPCPTPDNRGRGEALYHRARFLCAGRRALAVTRAGRIPARLLCKDRDFHFRQYLRATAEFHRRRRAG